MPDRYDVLVVGVASIAIADSFALKGSPVPVRASLNQHGVGQQ